LGGALIGRLSGPIGSIEPLPSPFAVTGWIAFLLGALGFLGAYWYALREPGAAPARAAATSYAAAGWVSAIARGGYAVADDLVARAQSGVLPLYAFGSLLAVAVVLFLREVVR
jgi:hypothetical protein